MSDIAVAIVIKKNMVLIVRRRQKEGSLHWQFPSGGIEKGETPMKASEREVLEETGIKCRAKNDLGDRIHPNTGAHVFYVFCEYEGGDAIVNDTEELDRVEWKTVNETLSLIKTSIFPAVHTLLTNIAVRHVD